MLTTLNPCWDFKTCTGYLVGKFKGNFESKMKVYVSTLMAKIPRSNNVKKDKIRIKSANQMFINEASSMPNTPTVLTSINYVEVSVDDDIVKKKANEDLYEKYKKEMPYPTPIYYIPFTVELDPGHRVTINGLNDSLVGLCASLE